MFPKIASLPLGIPKPRIVRLMRRRLAGSAPLGGSSRPSAVSPQQILRHRVTTNFTNGVTCGYSTLPTSPEGANVEVGSFVDKGVSGDRALDQAAEAFPGVLIDDPDDLYRPPVGSGIELEVHRPHSVGGIRGRQDQKRCWRPGVYGGATAAPVDLPHATTAGSPLTSWVRSTGSSDWFNPSIAHRYLFR